jgi:hypothetical protein
MKKYLCFIVAIVVMGMSNLCFAVSNTIVSSAPPQITKVDDNSIQVVSQQTSTRVVTIASLVAQQTALTTQIAVAQTQVKTVQDSLTSLQAQLTAVNSQLKQASDLGVASAVAATKTQ